MIINGWPEDVSDVQDLRKYFSHASTLMVEDGLVLQGETLLIPESKWVQVLQQLHDGHHGITKTNLWAKNVIYWPGMTMDIERNINSCKACQCFQVRQCDLPLEKQPTPHHQWEIVASDLFEFNGEKYIVMADMYSKMCFMLKMSSAGVISTAVISKMKEIFAENGVPDILRSDNGPQYTSAAFTEFTEECRFQHTTSSSHYPASNGFAESMVKIIKTVFTKGKDPQLALLALCSTTVDSHLPSPAQLLYQRKLKPRLPTQPSNTDPQADKHHDHPEDKALKCTCSTTTVCRTETTYTEHLQRKMDSRSSYALTVTQIIPSTHHCWSSVPLNMETPAG